MNSEFKIIAALGMGWHTRCLDLQEPIEEDVCMLELVFTVCAIAQPATCRDQHLLLDSNTTPWQCAMSAPPFIAQWGFEHPAWRVQRWTCQYPKKEKDI